MSTPGKPNPAKIVAGLTLPSGDAFVENDRVFNHASALPVLGLLWRDGKLFFEEVLASVRTAPANLATSAFLISA